jgi:hypothetical protein
VASQRFGGSVLGAAVIWMALLDVEITFVDAGEVDISGLPSCTARCPVIDEVRSYPSMPPRRNLSSMKIWQEARRANHEVDHGGDGRGNTCEGHPGCPNQTRLGWTAEPTVKALRQQGHVRVCRSTLRLDH